mmetsp:Transcript_11096/g.25582  ORF Transcript_11096/g.25582 Transcript_11096/m.25582 type:complete len:591 (-) Transcript_11096:418-2190(-)
MKAAPPPATTVVHTQNNVHILDPESSDLTPRHIMWLRYPTCHARAHPPPTLPISPCAHKRPLPTRPHRCGAHAMRPLLPLSLTHARRASPPSHQCAQVSDVCTSGTTPIGSHCAAHRVAAAVDCLLHGERHLAHLLLGRKLLLGHARAHRGRGGGATRGERHLLVHELGARPGLVLEDGYRGASLLPLDHLGVGGHPARGKLLDEVVRDQAVGVEARERDELPHEPALPELVGERLDLLVGHAGGVPVERGREVVREHLVGVRRVHGAGELVGLGEDGLGRLHPDQVGVRGVGLGACDREVEAGVEAVVALARTGRLPVKEWHVLLAAEQGGSLGLHRMQRGAARDESVPRVTRCVDLFEAHRPKLVHPLHPAVGQPLLLQSRAHRVREGLQARLVDPRLAARLSRRHRHAGCALRVEMRVERHALVDCRTQDECVVALVDIGGEERGRFRIGARHNQRRCAHHISLQPRGHQTVAVLLRRHEDLAAHVSTFLGAGRLVLKVDPGRSRLDHHLCQLHHRRKATVSRVAIRDDGRQEVGAGLVLSAGCNCRLPCLALVELKCLEELVHLVRDGIHRVVGKVGTRLIGRRGG